MTTTATDADLRDWLALFEQYFAPLLTAADYCTPDAPTPFVPRPDDLLDAHGNWPQVAAADLPAEWFVSVVNPLRLKSKTLRDAGVAPGTLNDFAQRLKAHDDSRGIPRACRRSAVEAAIKARDAVQGALDAPATTTPTTIPRADALTGRPDLGFDAIPSQRLSRWCQEHDSLVANPEAKPAAQRLRLPVLLALVADHAKRDKA